MIKPDNGAGDYRSLDLSTLEHMLETGDAESVNDTATKWFQLARQLRLLVVGSDAAPGSAETLDGIMATLAQSWHGSAATEFLAQGRIVRDYGYEVMQRMYNKGVEESMNRIGFSMHSVTEDMGIALSTAHFFLDQLKKSRESWAGRVGGSIKTRLDAGTYYFYQWYTL